MRTTGATLFFYGSLRERPLLAAVLGHGLEGLEIRPATAPGFRAACYPGRVYPALAEAPGQAVEGVAVMGLGEADVARLDTYEGVEYTRHPITLSVDGRTITGEVYRPGIVITADALPWDYATFRAKHGAAMDLSAGQSADDLRRQMEALKPDDRSMLEGDAIGSEAGDIVIHPVDHASMVLGFGGTVVYIDPVGGAERYADLPRPAAILITHIHGDHFDLPTLDAVLGGKTAPMITNLEVFEKLPDVLKSRAKVLRNGESGVLAGIPVEAVPSHNTHPDKQKFHPPGVGNGYVLSFGGRRVYVAGDTEDTPAMHALKNIDVAFLPMNQPYTMTPAQAASAVADFRPKIVYPIHYRGTDPRDFAALVPQDSGTEVRLREWYPRRD